MKVLLVIRGNTIKGGGGAERRFIRLLNYLNNPEIKLITNKEFAHDIVENKLLKNESLVIFPSSKMSILAFNLWLINKIKLLQPDVIHLVLIQKSLIPFYIWLNFFYKETIVMSSIVWTRYLPNSAPSLLDVLLGNLIWRRSKLIDLLYPSGLKSRWLKRHLSKIRVTPCSFTDYDLFKPSSQKKNIVCFVGRLIHEKNPLLFCEAILRLKKDYPGIALRWKFLILGKGKLENSLKKFIRLNSLEDVVQIINVFSTHEYLRKSKIFISLQEPTNYPSQALLEAMATENAIIATEDEDTKLLIDSENGILIQKNAEELLEALIKLMKDDKLREKLGKQARIKVLKEHNLDRFAEYMINFWSGDESASSK